MTKQTKSRDGAPLDAELHGKYGRIEAKAGQVRGVVGVYGRLNRLQAEATQTGVYMSPDLRARIDKLARGVSVNGAMVALLAYACEIVEREKVELSYFQNEGDARKGRG